MRYLAKFQLIVVRISSDARFDGFQGPIVITWQCARKGLSNGGQKRSRFFIEELLSFVFDRNGPIGQQKVSAIDQVEKRIGSFRKAWKRAGNPCLLIIRQVPIFDLSGEGKYSPKRSSLLRERR